MILHEEKLSSEKHFKSVGDFFCGADSPLDTFLSCNAFKYDEQKYGITYVLTESEASSEILGFYTLKASDLVQREIAESFNEECDLYMVSLDEI